MSCVWVAHSNAWGEPDFGTNSLQVGGVIQNWTPCIVGSAGWELPFYDTDDGYHYCYRP